MEKITKKNSNYKMKISNWSSQHKKLFQKFVSGFSDHFSDSFNIVYQLNFSDDYLKYLKLREKSQIKLKVKPSKKSSSKNNFYTLSLVGTKTKKTARQFRQS